MKKLNVAVIYGGVSPEHMISRISAETVINNLSSEKYNIIPVYIDKEGSWFMYDGYQAGMFDGSWEHSGANVSLSVNKSERGLIRFVRDKFKLILLDIIFPVLHGPYGEDGKIQGLFEMSGVPYVGCGVMASSLGADKSFMRVIAKSVKIPQTKYLVINKHMFKTNKNKITREVSNKINYPCFVKPCNGGSSIGIRKINNKQELIDAIDFALNYDQKIIIEKNITGREFECAVFGSSEQDNINISGIGELKYQDSFYSYSAKYRDQDSFTEIPAKISPDIADQIKKYSRIIFKSIDGMGLARVDFFLEDKTNKIFFNEINTLPGFTSISMYPKLWEQEGISLSVLLDKLIDLSIEKSKERKIWLTEQ